MFLRLFRSLLLLADSLFFLVVGIVIHIVFFFANSLRPKIKAFGTMLWAKTACRILRVKVRLIGDTETRVSSFTVCNHISYLDIAVLSSIVPSVYVARHDMKSWPVVGWLACMAESVFIDRTSKKAALAAINEMEQKISNGLNVIVFPEGTTSDGRTISPFKSALFDLPVSGKMPVTPISIRYTHINGITTGEDKLDSIAWYGDMKLFPHIWNLLGMASIDVSVYVGETIHHTHITADSTARKHLCLQANLKVVEGFNACVVPS
jgi:1-acyl-sn-glycerol-3-phosphate acyltransferase